MTPSRPRWWCAITARRIRSWPRTRRAADDRASRCRSRTWSAAAPRIKPQLLPMSTGRTPDVFHGAVHARTASGCGPSGSTAGATRSPPGARTSPPSSTRARARAELSNDLLIGARLLERAATGVPRQYRVPADRGGGAAAQSPATRSPAPAPRCRPTSPSCSTQYPLRELVTRGEQYGVWVDRPLARFSSWYELFPRSTGGWDTKGKPVHGTFATATKALPRVAKMGFDVVYLPPIHPIGKVHRKGRNNSVTAAPKRRRLAVGDRQRQGRPRRGTPEAGHHRGLRRFRRRRPRRRHGGGAGLRAAVRARPPVGQESPGVVHRAARRHHRLCGEPAEEVPGHLPDNFDNDPAGLYEEVLRVVRFWISHGVKVFRVDNPHTKPPNFWAWLIGEVKNEDPDVLFLSEAFTRPARLYGLAKLGFTQSYTYFTWRTAKWELTEFGEQIAEHADYARPNLFVNTPDILHESLQHGGPGMFAIRAVLASTMSSAWGVYSGYELFEHRAVREGSEEYLNSEKYELRPRDFEAALADGESLEPFLTRLNEIRRLHPALHELRTIKFHHPDNDALLAYSKFDPVTGDQVLVVVTLNPFGPEEATLWLDMAALGMEPYDRFWVRDEITGDEYQWGQANYVRLDPAKAVAHVLNMPQVPADQRLKLLRRE